LAKIGRKAGRLKATEPHFGFWILDFGLKEEADSDVFLQSKIGNPKSKMTRSVSSEGLTIGAASGTQAKSLCGIAR